MGEDATDGDSEGARVIVVSTTRSELALALRYGVAEARGLDAGLDVVAAFISPERVGRPLPSASGHRARHWRSARSRPRRPWSWQAEIPTGATIAYVVVLVAYFVLREGLLGQTIGKLMCGIRVVDANSGDVPGLRAASLRTLLRLVDGLLSYLVAFVMVLSSARPRGLGDMVPGTPVVRGRE
jgi:uncharacterized RDD family membrane protein YckC